jgi:hypothetical protein
LEPIDILKKIQDMLTNVEQQEDCHISEIDRHLATEHDKLILDISDIVNDYLDEIEND